MKTAPAGSRPRIALLHWGDLLEDFLDPIGVTFERFRDEMTGGWMFGYVEALQRAGVDTVLLTVTAEARRPERHRHRPTGATLWRVPASAPYRQVRSLERRQGGGRRAARQVGPYLATPLVRIGALLRREECRVLLCQEYEHPRFDACVLLGKVLSVPVFATFQGGSVHTFRLERWTRPLALRACRGVVVSTEHEAARVRAEYGLPAAKIARIPNPFDARAWRPAVRSAARHEAGLEPDALVVAWHGRVDIHTKGLDVLLEAWQELCAKPSDRPLCLLLIGTGPDSNLLRERLTALPGEVRWIDEYVLDPERRRRMLSAADVYCLPSRREGFPAAALEAMACGLPLVAAEGPAAVEIAPDGEGSGGVLVPVGDAPALDQALRRLLGDANLRRSLGVRAQQRVETAFAPESVGARLRTFLLDES